MNLCSLHENMKSQYPRAAIDTVYFKQSKFHSAHSACFQGAAIETHLLWAIIRVTSERLLGTSLRFKKLFNTTGSSLTDKETEHDSESNGGKLELVLQQNSSWSNNIGQQVKLARSYRNLTKVWNVCSIHFTFQSISHHSDKTFMDA